MSNYAKITDFSAKDALTSGDPEKIILGSDVDAELTAISTAITSKYDSATTTITLTGNFTAATITGTLFTGTLFSGSGASLTSLSASNISSGSLADARLSANVPLINAANVFTNRVQSISAVGVTSTLIFLSADSSNAYVGVADAASSIFIGDVAGMACIGGATGVGLSGDNNTLHHKFTSSNATTTFNGVAVSDFARLSQSNTFTQSIAGAAQHLFVNSSNNAAAYLSARLQNDTGRQLLFLLTGSANVSSFISGDASAEEALIYTGGATPLYLGTNNIARLGISTAGNFDFKGGTVTTNGASAAEVGTHGLPQNSQSVNYTTVLGDRDKNLHQTGASKTFTIDSNANVAYPIGTVLNFTTDNATGVSIAITTDTLRLAGTATTGTRTLAQYGVATAIKILATTWLISGAGLS